MIFTKTSHQRHPYHDDAWPDRECCGKTDRPMFKCELTHQNMTSWNSEVREKMLQHGSFFCNSVHIWSWRQHLRPRAQTIQTFVKSVTAQPHCTLRITVWRCLVKLYHNVNSEVAGKSRGKRNLLLVLHIKSCEILFIHAARETVLVTSCSRLVAEASSQNLWLLGMEEELNYATVVFKNNAPPVKGKWILLLHLKHNFCLKLKCLFFIN